MKKEEGMATAAIDSEKYFDSICWEVTFHELDRVGLYQRIWKSMLNFIAHLFRFNKVAGTLGAAWTCTNSIIQGCSLSTVWARVLEEEVPTVLCNSIVDDQRLKRRSNCKQPSRSRETLTEPRGRDSIH